VRKIDKFIQGRGNVNAVCEDILQMFGQNANIDTLSCEFDVSKGSGRMQGDGPNTIFVCDICEPVKKPRPGETIAKEEANAAAKRNAKLKELQKALFDEDLEYKEGKCPVLDPATGEVIVSGEPITKEEAAEIEKKINAFMKLIGERLTEHHAPELRSVVRRVLMPGSDEVNLPLDPLRVETIEIADWSSLPEPAKYLLRIGKFPSCDIDTGEVVQFIQERQEEEEAETAEQIFEKYKDSSLMLKGIASVETLGKYVFEFSMNIFVDYSYAAVPPSLDAPEEKP